MLFRWRDFVFDCYSHAPRWRQFCLQAASEEAVPSKVVEDVPEKSRLGSSSPLHGNYSQYVVALQHLRSLTLVKWFHETSRPTSHQSAFQSFEIILTAGTHQAQVLKPAQRLCKGIYQFEVVSWLQLWFCLSGVSNTCLTLFDKARRFEISWRMLKDVEGCWRMLFRWRDFVFDCYSHAPCWRQFCLQAASEEAVPSKVVEDVPEKSRLGSSSPLHGNYSQYVVALQHLRSLSLVKWFHETSRPTSHQSAFQSFEIILTAGTHQAKVLKPAQRLCKGI